MKKLLFSLVLGFLATLQSFAQGSLTLPVLSANPNSTVSVPVLASGINGATGFSLDIYVESTSSTGPITLDTVGTLLGELSSDPLRFLDLVYNSNGNNLTIVFSDFNAIPFNIGLNDTLFNLVFAFNGNPSPLIWSIASGTNQFNDALGSPIQISTLSNGILNNAAAGNISINTICSDVSACENGSATFSLTASNTTSYQWQISTDSLGSSFVNISGATSASYTRNNLGLNDHKKLIQCRLSNSSGSHLSCAVRFNVLENQFRTVTLNNNSTSNSICSGSSVTFTANLNSPADNPVYSWTVNGTVVSGVTSNVYTFSPATNPTSVSVSLSSSSGCLAANPTSVLSNSITVNNTPSLFIVNGGGGYCAGSNGVSITLSGSQNNVTYQLLRNGLATGTPLSGSGNSLSFANITATGTYTVQATNPSNCSNLMTGSASVSLNPLPVFSATSSRDTVYLGGGNTNLGINTAETGLSYQWSVAAGPNTNNNQFSNTNTSSPIFTPGTAGTYTLSVRATNNASNCQSTSTVTLVVNNAPTIALNSVSLCSGSSANLDNFVTVTGGNPSGVGAWSGTGVSGSVFNSSGLAIGSYTLTYTYTLQGIAYSSNVAAIVKANSTASISQTICAGSSFAFGSTTYNSSGVYTRTVPSANGCDSVITLNLTVNSLPTVAISSRTNTVIAGDTVSLFASPNLSSYQWDIVSGPSTNINQLSSATVQNPLFTPSLTGTYVLNYTGTAANTCQNTSINLTITVSNLSVNAGNDISTCSNSNAINLNGSPSGGVWTGAAVSGNISVGFTFNPVTSGVGSFTLTYSVTSGSSTFTDELVVTVNPTSSSTVNDTICPGGSYSFGTTTLTTAGQYFRTIPAANGCDSVITLNLGVRNITATATPASSTTICQGQSLIINANAGSGRTYQWYIGSNAITGATNSSVSVTQAGIYQVRVLESGCEVSSNNITVTVNPLPVVSVSANPGTSINLGSTVTLSASSNSGINSVSWNPATNLSSATVTNPVFTPSSVGTFTYTVTLTNSNGCVNTASITITVSQGVPTWTGNGNWSSSTNWSTGSVPSSTSNVLISSGTVTVSDERTVADLTINSNSTVVIASNQSLTVNGALTNNGTLTVSDKGSLVQGNSSTISGNGTSRLIRVTGNNNDTIYNYHSSPVQGATVGMLGASDTRNHYTYNASTGWVSTPVNTVMSPGIGYSSTGTPLGTVTFNVSGSNRFNNGTISANISGDTTLRGWNLVGNPYPSSISAGQFLSANPSLFQALWFWSQEVASTWPFGTLNGDYASWNQTGGTAGSFGGGVPNGSISSGQAFFIKVPAANSNLNSVVFSNNQRTSANDSAVVFRNASIERAWINVNGPHNSFNQTLIGFTTDATNGFDNGYDAEKMKGNSRIALYTMLGTQDYSIQGFSTRSNSLERVPLGLDVAVAGVYELSLDQMEGFPSGTLVAVKDFSTGLLHNLVSGPYSFNVSQGGSIRNRFEIHFDGQASGNEPIGNSKINIHLINNFLNISGLDTDDKVQSLELVDLTGKIVYSTKYTANPFLSVDLNQFNQGVYFARINTLKYQLTRKFLINQ